MPKSKPTLSIREQIAAIGYPIKSDHWEEISAATCRKSNLTIEILQARNKWNGCLDGDGNSYKYSVRDCNADPNKDQSNWT